jgi:hypothetical protein
VPDKRRDSKQRRAARNQQYRGSLAARRENAATSPAAPSSTKSTTSGRGGWLGGGRSAAATPTASMPPPEGGLMGMLRSKRPGDRAVLAALVLAIIAAVAVLFLPVKVDDKGDPLPRQYGAVTQLAREELTGKPLPDKTETLVSANGPQILLVLLLPVAVAGFAVWANRRPDRSRLLTFAMIVMAGTVLLGLGFYFLPALIALFIAGYQVRRADMPARMAESATGGAPRRRWFGGGVIDVDSTEAGDADDTAGEPAEAASTNGAARSRRSRRRQAEPADAVAEEDTNEGADDADPLAELEAELEAERAAEADDRAAEPDDDDADPDGGGTGRRL